jgi:hypothetical protein
MPDLVTVPGDLLGSWPQGLAGWEGRRGSRLD